MRATPDSTLANPEQRIADLERQLAERTAERDEAQRNLNQATTERDELLAQQTATAEVLQVINSSPGHLKPVFDAMVERALRLCDAQLGALAIFDKDHYRAMSAVGPPELVEFVANAVLVQPDSVLDKMRRGEDDAVQITDLAAFPPERRTPGIVAMLEMGGARTSLWVSLRKDNIALGFFAIYRQEVRPFTDKQIALLQNFAAQAVIAIENARLLTETHEALERQTATAEILRVMSASPTDLQPTFDAIATNATILSGAETGGVFRFDGSLIHFAAHYGYGADLMEAIQRDFPTRPGRHSAAARAILTREVVHIPDAAVDPEYALPAMLQTGVHTVLSVPILHEGNPVGVITVTRREVEPFSQGQIDLLKTFADQAVIAIENVRLFNETREALDQQTATAEVLQVINASPGDLAPVFDAMLQRAIRLCDAIEGVLWIIDGERGHLAASQGLPREFVDLLSQHAEAGTNPALQRVMQGERVVHFHDVTEHELYRSGDPVAKAAVPAGVRTLVWVALVRKGTPVGAFAIGRREVRPFTATEIALLQNFAAQAVIAMENARLLTETREALEQQTATAEVLQVINASPGDLAPVFDAMLAKFHSLCGADNGTLLTYDGKQFWPVAWHGVSRPLTDAEGVNPNVAPSFGRIVRGERLDHIHDMEEFAARVTDDATRRRLAALIETEGIRTQLVVALRKDDLLLGAITANRKVMRPFSEKEIALLENFAEQAVIAMENARLLTETREALEQQTATAEVLQVINNSPGDLGPVFDAILEKAHSLCGSAYGALVLYDGEYFRAVAVRGYPHQLAETICLPFRGAAQHQELVRGARYVQTPDIQALVPERIGSVGQAAKDAGFRTMMLIPLRKDNTLLGQIAAARTEVRPFSDKEIALLENFAAQAVIAMENARLITETREALEQQTATAEVLGVINSSPGDLEPVFETILQKAHTLCGAEFGTLFLRDGDDFRGVGVRALPKPFAERLRQGFRGTDAPVSRPLLDGERYVQLPDLTIIDHPIARLATEHGTRTVLSIPLRKDGAVVGLIIAARSEVRLFSEREIALVENFAAQAVIAMENARLLGELRQRTEEVAELNRGLEARVAEQVDELGRVGRLKRFLAPQLAELIVSHGDEKILESHRRDIVVVFCDLRGYTAFTETAEPEEVLDFLREYHGELGPLVSQFEGTLDQFSGDGIMVFFNDPVPIPDPAERAVKMAMAMREAAGDLIGAWRRRRGRVLGFGVGIAQGYATLGQIGFADRSGYTAIGTVCNLAARLCAEAKDGQILVGQSVAVAVEETTTLEEVGELTLKGLTQPVAAYNVPFAASQPALRVIEGGPESV